MNTRVGPKAELVRCVTQAGYEIESGGLRILNSPHSMIDDSTSRDI
jgi:hypothetical protein